MSINNKRSYTEYTVTTATTDFVIGFDEYDDGTKDTIVVTVNGDLAESQGYTVMRKNAQVITITPAVQSGTVRLTRETGIDEPFHKFTAGALFSAKSVDENFQQIQHSQQEVRDAFVYTTNYVNTTLSAYDARIVEVEDSQDSSNQRLVTEIQARKQGDLDSRRYAEDILGMGNIWDGISTRSVIDTVTGLTQADINAAQAQVNAETVSLLSFGAPYSTDSTTHLQKAIDYLDSKGGGVLTIPYHTGELVLNGTVNLKPNITVDCAKNLVVNCEGANSNGYNFSLLGSLDSEILNTSKNLTSGSYRVSFETPHNYVSGDILLIVSQRECAHADAGLDWRLGETTSGVESPYFAEPIIVETVVNATTVKLRTPILFPDYLTNKLSETSPTARPRTTVQKMNLASNFRWVGGIFHKGGSRIPESAKPLQSANSLFSIKWAKDAVLDIEAVWGHATGIAVNNMNSYKSDITLKISRPANWKLIESHQRYNSIKDISSWYTKVNLDEENGSQGLDQTYSLYPCIYPTYKVKHVGASEDGMTTHGISYGMIADILAINCKATGIRNRARFSTINLYALNCYQGFKASTYGCVDNTYNVQIINFKNVGAYFESQGVTSLSPAKLNTTLTGLITSAPFMDTSYEDVNSKSATATAVYVKENTNVGGYLLKVDSTVGFKKGFYVKVRAGSKVASAKILSLYPWDKFSALQLVDFSRQLTPDEVQTASVEYIGDIEGTSVIAQTNVVSAQVIEPDLYTDSSLSFNNLRIKSNFRAINCRNYINGVSLNNVDIEIFGNSHSHNAISMVNSSGHSFNGVRTVFKSEFGDIKNIALQVTSFNSAVDRLAYGKPVCAINYDTCKVTNGELMTSNIRLFSVDRFMDGTPALTRSLIIDKDTFVGRYQLKLLTGGKSNNRIILSSTMPLGATAELTLINAVPEGVLDENEQQGFGAVTFYPNESGEIIHFNTDSLNVVNPRTLVVKTGVLVVKVTRVTDKEFYVST